MRRYPDVFVMTGGGNVGLREVLGPDAVSVPVPPPRMPKLRDDQVSSEVLEQIVLTDQVYGDLHAHLATQGPGYQAVVQRLLAICRQVEQSSFLALEEVVLGGAAGKGLLTAGVQAEIVLFVRQLPYKNFAQWLPHILDTLAPVLEQQLKDKGAEQFVVEKDHLHFRMASAAGASGGKGAMTIQVYLSPVFRGQEHLLDCIRAAPPAERLYFYPAMVKERNDFVGGQSQQTKVLIRLMTWWASRQSWSSALATPSDWLLELVVIHACLQLQQTGGGAALGAFDLAEMITKVMELLANFESIKVLWADSGAAKYSLQDIWRPLLSHEPLFMDPLNPYCNLADVNSFDVHELAKAARPPGCVNTFKRQAVQQALVQVGGQDGEGEDDDEYEDATEE